MARTSTPSKPLFNGAPKKEVAASALLKRMVPLRFQVVNPGYPRTESSVWHYTIKYIDYLRSAVPKPTPFDLDHNNRSPYANKHNECRTMLATIVPQKYKVKRRLGTMGIVRYIRRLLVKRSRRGAQEVAPVDMSSESEDNVKSYTASSIKESEDDDLSNTLVEADAESEEEHPSANTKAVDEAGILDAVEQIQELLSVTEEHPGPLITLAEARVAQWGNARDNTRNFVEGGDTPLDTFINSVALLKADFPREVDGQFTSKQLLKIGKKMNKKIKKVLAALEVLKEWLSAGDKDDSSSDSDSDAD